MQALKTKASFIWALAIVSCTWPGAALSDRPLSTTTEANQLIQQVVDNEVYCVRTDHTHWMYRQRHVDGDKDLLQECVGTEEGTLCRHLAVDGRILSAIEQQAEKERIESLVKNPEEARKQQSAHREDGERALEMLKMLPRAFDYQYAGKDGPYTVLNFTPNAEFKPPNRESRVFHAMVGVLWIEPISKRLAGLKGRLTQDVEFGWGLLGRLYKGGTFDVKREDVGSGHWETTLLNVDIRGKALFFHGIHAQQKEVAADFKRLSDTLSLGQAAFILESPRLEAALIRQP